MTMRQRKWRQRDRYRCAEAFWRRKREAQRASLESGIDGSWFASDEGARLAKQAIVLNVLNHNQN